MSNIQKDTDDGFQKREDLLDRLENQTQVFKNKSVKDAFQAIDRKDFLGEDYKIEAYEDYSLPTLKNQTISQPTTIAFMLELLDVQRGDVVLDIGSGSGWTTALLGHMVGRDGKVIGLEILPELVEQSRKNLEKYKDLPVEIVQAEKETGYYKQAPYNRILGGAAFPDKETAPMELIYQLAIGGVMVIPIGESIWKFERYSEDDYYETEYPGFAFVPYIQ